MRKTLKQTIRGYTIPNYIIDILTYNMCRSFLDMTVIHEGDTYIITYSASHYEKIDTGKMDFCERVKLLYEVLEIIADNEDHLIGPSNYLIEPELLYRRTGGDRRLKMLFYPDRNLISAEKKMQAFAEKLREGLLPEQAATIEKLKHELGAGDIARVYRLIDRILDRYEAAA